MSSSGGDGRLSSLRRPRFEFAAGNTAAGAVGTSSIPTAASYVLLCRRRYIDGIVGDDEDPAAAAADLYDGEDDDKNQIVSLGHPKGAGSAGEGGASTSNHNTTSSRSAEQPSMEQCVTLLAPHLAVFRETGEVPPQLLRVARFFRWRWGPLKRALLRPACSDDDENDTNDTGKRNANDDGNDRPPADTADQLVEVGSAYRLRLARALHGRGLLSLAECDGLVASFERRSTRRKQKQKRQTMRRSGSGGGSDVDDSIIVLDDVGDNNNNDDDDNEFGSSSKKRKWEEEDDDSNDREDDLNARLRLALSRLPSDACGPSGDDRAKRGLRYAKSVLLEWKERRRNAPSTSTAAGEKEDGAAVGCASPEEVADWALTAFTGIVLTNGIDYHFRSRRGVQFKSDENDVESSFASIMFDDLVESNGINKGGKRGELGLAIHEKIRAFLSPQLIDDLSNIHILSLARLFSHSPYDLVEDIFVDSLTLCARQSVGGVGMQQLSKLIASYLSLVGPEVIDVTKLEANLEKKIKEKNIVGDGLSGGSAERQDGQNVEYEVKRILSFLNIVFRATRFLLRTP